MLSFGSMEAKSIFILFHLWEKSTFSALMHLLAERYHTLLHLFLPARRGGRAAACRGDTDIALAANAVCAPPPRRLTTKIIIITKTNHRCVLLLAPKCICSSLLRNAKSTNLRDYFITRALALP